MLLDEIRKKFLTYFKNKGHTIVPSAPTVPHDDPTLLFNNAGMNQFKDVFLGKNVRDYTRAASCQTCIRVGGKHNDLDNVGHTSSHTTFFEMLGNFSFGDYFKKEAISYAWEVSTQIFELNPKRIWVSVFEEDEEAWALWKEILPEKRIVRFGKKENFWSMGERGPCGPCSELLYDRGASFGPGENPHKDPSGERFLEFWNLVFMQYNRQDDGQLTKLPKPCVDTGAGLERVVSLILDVPTLFQTEVFASLITQIEEISGVKYDPKKTQLTPPFHVIADHIRSLAFAIAHGAEPSNTERGYVLRKILRRAVRYGRLLGIKEPFLARVFPRLIQTMGPHFQELKKSEKRITEILTSEEESFFHTLRRGGNILNAVIEKAEQNTAREISGEDAFKLKDTYGFPLEEILLLAKDSHLSVNLDTYQILEKHAREKSRQAKKAPKQIVEKNIFEAFVKTHGTCEFVGYEQTESEGTIKGIFVEGTSVDQMVKGEEGVIVLDQTPFYAEKGGQVEDRGALIHQHAHFLITHCQAPYPGVITHGGTLQEGVLIVGEPVMAQIEKKRRLEISKHHTATHLLHYALQKILGPHIRQAGSLVEPNRLRFDFNHHKALTKENLRQIEKEVNQKIWENLLLKTYILSFDEAQNHPEIKQFFGEKYETKVRVVDINGYSKELCGGTHVDRLGSIGYFRIFKEGSIAKGVRRIEAVIGPHAETLRYQGEDRLHHIAHSLKSNLPHVEEALDTLLQENETLKKDKLHQRKESLGRLTSKLISEVNQIETIALLDAVVEIEKNELIPLAHDLVRQMRRGVVLLTLIQGTRCHLLLRVSEELVSEGIYANKLITMAAPVLDGSGGGKKTLAQAGGKQLTGLPLARGLIKEEIVKILEKKDPSN